MKMLRAQHYSPSYTRATGSVEPYRGVDHTVETMVRLAKGNVDPRQMVGQALQDERSIPVRRHTEQIIGNIRPKDYTSEVIAIGKWWGNAGRYTRDPVHVEMLRTVPRLIGDATSGSLACDCFPTGTLLLRDDFSFVSVDHVRAGDKIWGYDRWSMVTGHISKGTLGLDAIRLNNGSWLRLTPDHKVYVAECNVHPSGHRSERPCWCHMDQRTVKRITVAELEPNMVLIAPDRLPFGAEEQDPDFAYLDGVYLSDGWNQDGYCFFISGQDGCPKEEQKREVQEICTRHGIETTWLRKSINVRNSDLAKRMATMGSHAPQKHALTINLGEGAAAALLRGIMADSGVNTMAGVNKSRTFTTTSRQLMLQTRVLHKMFGMSCGYSYIEDHGGLGENPIYRLSQRLRKEDGGNGKLLRVKEIQRAAGEAPCFDISTDDHYVYLPEHDVTVSNCDEFALAIGASCLTIGAEAEFVTVGFDVPMWGAPPVYTHVFCRAQDPRSKVWWVLDPVAGRRTAQMLKRVKVFKTYRVQ
jgi:hypothetical protein